MKTRYERFWDYYSDNWDKKFRPPSGKFLGDEWGYPEGTVGVFNRVIHPYLRPDATVIEIGPGGGKYTALVAPLCKSLICVDVSNKMLDRTKERLRGYSHVQYVKTSGKDPLPAASQSVDFVFSIDCFVHLDMPDFYCYLKEIHRVLKSGGFASVHFADLMTKEGWDKFVKESTWDKEDLTGMEAPTGGMPRYKYFANRILTLIENMCLGLNLSEFHTGPFGFITHDIARKFVQEIDFEIILMESPHRDGYMTIRKG